MIVCEITPKKKAITVGVAALNLLIVFPKILNSLYRKKVNIIQFLIIINFNLGINTLILPIPLKIRSGKKFVNCLV